MRRSGKIKPFKEPCHPRDVYEFSNPVAGYTGKSCSFMAVYSGMTNLFKTRSYVKSTHRSIIKVCLFCCAVFFLSSCAENQEGMRNNIGRDVPKLTCLIVLPTETPVDIERRMDSAEVKNLQKGAFFIDSVIAEELKNFKGPRLFNAAQLQGLITEIYGSKTGMIKGIGKELKCDAILMTTIKRFHQREGGDFAADFPASAAFAMDLIRVDDGKVLWSGSFDETQESLLSNLFTFGKAQSRGFKWVTVEDLVRQGVHERLSACPYLE
jgi:hypothetical protein